MNAVAAGLRTEIDDGQADTLRFGIENLVGIREARRTVVTGVTSLLAVLALFFFGGPVLEGFSLALFIGILVGTYSSIFVSSPVVYLWPAKK